MSRDLKGSRSSLMGGFFYGEVDEKLAFPYPSLQGEQRVLIGEIIQGIGKFCREEVDSKLLDETGAIPEKILRGLGELGLWGLGVPESYGGLGLDNSLYSRAFDEIAGYDGALATTLGAHQSIGCRALLLEGTEAQKKKWLPALASGESIAAFCLTEPGSGSDAYSICTKATKSADGNTYTIKGQKIWITNGGLASHYTVFCKTKHPKGEKISCFIVEKDRPGVSFGERENKMGIRASETRAVFFDDVTVPADNMIGAPGKGFKIAMNVLNRGRLSLGAGSVGVIKRVLTLATAHAKGRKQFGKTIDQFGLIQQKLTHMAALCYATESMVYMTTGHMDEGLKDYYLETAVCKVYGSEALWQVVDMGLQIAGGAGYMREYPYERLMRDSRIYPIFEGTNEILRCFIALAGLSGPSEKLQDLGKLTDVAKALRDPIKSLGVLTEFAKGRLSKIIPGHPLSKVHPALEAAAAPFPSMLSHLAIQGENTLIKYGKGIVDNELPLARIANMAMELYVHLAVLSRTTAYLEQEQEQEQEQQGLSQDKKEYVTELTRFICRESHLKFQTHLKDMAQQQQEDDRVKKVAAFVGANDGYGLDIAFH